MAGRLRVVIVEASIETVPRQLWGHPAVVASAKRRGKPPGRMLLDSTLHHTAMKRLGEYERRGRPDVAHLTLLQVLGSPLAREGLLEVYVHTRMGVVVEVSPETRLPRVYRRFVGLIEQLLEEGAVPPGRSEPLLRIVDVSLKDLLDGVDYATALTPAGDKVPAREVARSIASVIRSGGIAALVLRGFPFGDFTVPLPSCSKLSIYREELEPWVEASIVLSLVADELSLL